MILSQGSPKPSQSPGTRRAKVVATAKRRRKSLELPESLSGDPCHTADAQICGYANKYKEVDKQIHVKLGPHVTSTLVSICACVL